VQYLLHGLVYLTRYLEGEYYKLEAYMSMYIYPNLALYLIAVRITMHSDRRHLPQLQLSLLFIHRVGQFRYM